MLQKLIKSVILGCFYLINRNRKSKVIFYHDVHLENMKYTDMSTSMSKFKSHILKIRKNGFEIVGKIEKSSNQIQVCFDDGFRGIYDNKDYFVKESISPTIFLAISLIGKEGYLSETEILELQTLGFIFESHAFSHVNLVSFSDKQLEFELVESKRILESLLNKEITEICFPIGFFSKRVIQFCKSAGYQKMYSSIPGDFFDEEWNGVSNRNLVQFLSAGDVRNVILGSMAPFRNYYKRKHFIVEK